MKSEWKFQMAAFFICVVLFTGCSRYEHVPKAPKRKVMRIEITTKQPPASNFYYYLAFEAPDNGDDTGPRSILGGEERARDWTYYIRYHGNIFEEKAILTDAQRDDIPDVFNSSSERYYTAVVSGNTVRVEIWLDKLINISTGQAFVSIPGEILLNFITGSGPISQNEDAGVVIDSLRSPFLAVQTSHLGFRYQSSDFSNIDSLDVADAENFPADIVSWVVVIDEK